MRNPITATYAQDSIAKLIGSFVMILIVAFFLGAVQGYIAQTIWNNISSAQYHINFWQAWGGFVIVRMALATNVQTKSDK